MIVRHEQFVMVKVFLEKGGGGGRATKTPVIHSELNQMSPCSSHLLYMSLLTFLFHSWEPSPMTSLFILMTSSPTS